MKQKYLDIQVNGYGGIDFNQNDLCLNDLKTACIKLKNDNVAGVFATIITADFDDMITRIRQLVQLRKQDTLICKIIKGIHIEGPFLNNSDGYRGAHPKKHILKGDIVKMKQLIDAANGLTRIVTLAPEVDKNYELIKFLHNKGVIISAGHCNPNLDELKEAIKAGLSMFTHLGNGCPKDLPRHDNIIQKALAFKDNLTLCFIADGIHIPFFALKNYIAIAGIKNCVITTDAMAAAGAQPGKYTLGNIELEVGQDKIVREPGKNNFAGSAIDMKSSASNLKKEMSFPQDEIFQLTYENPANIFKL